MFNVNLLLCLLLMHIVCSRRKSVYNQIFRSVYDVKTNIKI